MECPDASAQPLTSVKVTQPSWSLSATPMRLPPSFTSSTLTRPVGVMSVTMRVTGSSPVSSRTVKDGPKSENMAPYAPMATTEMKATGDGTFVVTPFTVRCTVWFRHRSLYRWRSRRVPSVNTTMSWATTSSSVSSAATSTSTPLLSSRSAGATASAMGRPNLSSVRKKFEPWCTGAAMVVSSKVTCFGPASVRFFATSMPTPFTPTMSALT
mmetsp:Transcript_64599/g.131311  ORF Transcript_64599/g.131311 Transcript_64599/m.131311 type:complete len:212 (-) Transcript_64599:214-849(-)